MNTVDPVSILETGAKMALLMLSVSCYGRKLKQGGNRKVVNSNAGKERRDKNYKETEKRREDTST